MNGQDADVGRRPPPAFHPQLLDAGEGWQETVDASGQVAATFGRACYVRLGERLLAVGGPVPAGPLHLRVGGPGWEEMGAALRVGDPVDLRDGRLRVAGWALDLSAATAWRPPPVDTRRLYEERRFALAIISRHDLAARCGIRAEDIEAASKSLERADLEEVAARLGGRGPGLTPAGDDYLAGALVADALLRPERARYREAAAAAVRTTDISRAFLEWAARGRSIDPLHRLLVGVAGACSERAGEAVASLAAIGATSGAALALGALTRVHAELGLS